MNSILMKYSFLCGAVEAMVLVQLESGTIFLPTDWDT